MSDHPVVAPKKLIEVALPLDEINKAAAREKSIRHGHPSTLHLWWARRPLAAARAVLFAQLVNDPSWKYSEEELKKPQIKSAVTRKRNELFKLITRLVQWENTNNQEVLEQARKEIRASWAETCEANKNHPDANILFNPEKLPPLHDPFAGGGAIPLEAQRLGLEAHASDLNPVAVLINKSMIEIPPAFGGRPPVGPVSEGEKQTKVKAAEDWSGAKGLSEDVRRYGAWMRAEAEKRIGHLYPKVEITNGMAKKRPDLEQYVGQQLTVIAWLWARTVKSPTPAFAHVDVPLVSTFMLSTKKGREAHVEPIVARDTYHFEVRLGAAKNAAQARSGTKGTRGANFMCLLSGAPILADYIRTEAKAGRLGVRMLAIVAEGRRERVFLSPTDEAQTIATSAIPPWKPDTTFFAQALGFRIGNYGFTKWSEAFTERQLATLATFVELVAEARLKVESDAIQAGQWQISGARLSSGGTEAAAYADAVAIYLALGVSRSSDYWSNLCTWRSDPKNLGVGHVFSKQTLNMIWDFAEGNPFSNSSGNWTLNLDWIVKFLARVETNETPPGTVQQEDVRKLTVRRPVVFSTDPPYYDNIGYADLSDFFYVWLRRAVMPILPELFATMSTPKDEELVATPVRHGTRSSANAVFLAGMTDAMGTISRSAHPAVPISIYYAFKQSETDEEEGTSSAGWESFLSAVLAAGFAICGTWPVRTELGNRTRSMEANALASSIVLACRPRVQNAHTVARKDFLRHLARILPSALAEMTADPEAAVAPVDLAQAAIGPGMAIFSRYAGVLEADGQPMSVHSALVHLNKAVDDYFAHTEAHFDADTRFCLGWFQQRGFDTGSFGEADVLARAKGTAVDGMAQAGVLSAAKGRVRLLRIGEYPTKWDPTRDGRVPVWEACHQMCRALAESEGRAGELLARMPDKQDAIRQLAYRLYTICERKKWADDARAYNELITSWPAIIEHSVRAGHIHTQLDLLS